MKQWGLLLGALAILPLVLPLMTVAVGMYAIERTLVERRLERKALDAWAAYGEAVRKLRARVIYRPTSWERILGDPLT